MQSLKHKSLVPKACMPALVDRMIRRITREGHLSGFTDEQVLSVLRDAKSSLEPQPATLEIDAPIVIFGDIHGQLRDLLRFFTIVGPPPQNKILFLGDYVDRCKKSFEVIMLLLCYRIKFPHLIHLLRGNHECSKMNRLYGFYEELRRKRCVYMWKKFQEVFNEMPLCAVVSSRLLCMHGGISPEIQNWDSLVTLQKPKTPRACDDGIAVDLMWSDPSTDSCTGFQFNATRATSYIFGGDTIANICDMLDISMVVRAHEVVRGGHQFMYDRKLVTIFSAPNYCGTDGNAASVMKVSRRLEISFVTLKPRLDTNRLTEEKRQLLEKLAADAMAKSPDPCSRQLKDKAASNNDDCLIGPTAPPDTKGSEMQQRKTQLLSLMDAFETPSGAKAAAATKSAPASGPTAAATAKKRDTTPAPPVSVAGAPAAITRPPSSGSQQSQAVSTAKPGTPRQIMTSPITQKDSDLIVSPPPRSDKTLPTAGSRPSSSPQKRATIALIYNCKSTDSQTNGKPCPAPAASSSQTNGKPSPAPAASSNGAAPSKAVETSQRKQSPTTKEIPPPVGQQAPRRTESSSGTSDSGTSSGNTSERTQASIRAPSPAKAKSVEEAAKTAIAATKTPPQPDPKSQNEIIDATEKALKNIKPAEPKQ